MKASERAFTRRQPKQQRSHQIVEAVLEATQRVLRRQGAEAITTNRVAEAAGVSIGSLYQYFADKQAIFMALHDRHVSGVRHVIEQMGGSIRVHSELGKGSKFTVFLVPAEAVVAAPANAL